MVFERLSPVERAVFLLREVFDYPYEEIAQNIERSQTKCRQIFKRARQHLATYEARYEQQIDLLTVDAVFYGDGGGKATAVRQPLLGRDRVAAYVVSLFKQAPRLGATAEPVLLNGGPGIIAYDREGKVLSVLALEIRDGLVNGVGSIVNPDKLRHLGPVSDITRVRRQAADVGA